MEANKQIPHAATYIGPFSRDAAWRPAVSASPTLLKAPLTYALADPSSIALKFSGGLLAGESGTAVCGRPAR